MVVALIAASACNMTGVPQVAGTYTGTATFVVGTTVAEIPMRLIVEQSGSQVTVTASMTYQGRTSGFPAMTGTIGATGAVIITEIAGVTAPLVSDFGCGTVRGGYFTLTFSGREAHWNMAFEYSRCGAIGYSAVLTR